jgi:hypothetical protein
MKQKQLMTVHILLTIQSLEDIIKFFHPRMLELQERIERLRALGPLPAALYTLTNPSDADFVTLGGLLPPPTAPTPSHPQTPAGRMTPAPPVAIPTPPHMTGPTTRQRRNGFSDAPGNMASPASFQTSPAAVLPSAASPAAPSPPKTGKVTRPRGGQKQRKQSKSANTPTPAAVEPASTPTPAAAAASTPAPVSLKRSFDEAEAQAPSQPGPQPSAKRLRTEPSPPAMPPKPVTPPPQISAPINRDEIRTAEDANDLLTDAFKRSEEQAEIFQSQGQSSQDFDLEEWLSQIVASSLDPVPSAFIADLALALPPLTGETEAQIEGADIEFFDYGAYCDTDATTVPELDQRPTLSPESHNDATTTPPSQSNVPARPGAKAVEQKAAGTDAPLATAKVDDVQIGTADESEYRNFFENPDFSYGGAVEPFVDPWAIA